MLNKVRSGFAPRPAGRPGLGSLHALQADHLGFALGLDRSGQSVGRVTARCRRRIGLTTAGAAAVGRSQAYGTVSCRTSQVLRALEVLKQVCLKRVDLASGQRSVHDLDYRGRSSPGGSSWL